MFSWHIKPLKVIYYLKLLSNLHIDHLSYFY